MELTAEQLQKAESMSLEELRAAALAEAQQPVTDLTQQEQPAADKQRDDKGRFVSAAKENEAPVEQQEENGEPTKTIYRREIPNGSGSVDVYEAETMDELVEKLAVAKENANKKIQEFIAENRQRTAQQTQVNADEDYVIAERLKKNPKQTMKEVVAEVIKERAAETQRSLDVQNHFMAAHPDFIANPKNGARMEAWHKTHGYTEFTPEGLEKAYQDLKSSGLLELKPQEANAVAEDKGATTQRTAEPTPDATQQRSSQGQRGSTISTRNSVRATTPTNTQPTEDELYKMPLDKLREMANTQLKNGNQ